MYCILNVKFKGHTVLKYLAIFLSIKYTVKTNVNKQRIKNYKQKKQHAENCLLKNTYIFNILIKEIYSKGLYFYYNYLLLIVNTLDGKLLIWILKIIETSLIY